MRRIATRATKSKANGIRHRRDIAGSFVDCFFDAITSIELPPPSEIQFTWTSLHRHPVLPEALIGRGSGCANPFLSTVRTRISYFPAFTWCSTTVVGNALPATAIPSACRHCQIPTRPGAAHRREGRRPQSMGGRVNDSRHPIGRGPRGIVVGKSCHECRRRAVASIRRAPVRASRP